MEAQRAITVKLYGDLAERFTDEIVLYAGSVLEVSRALECLFPDYRSHLILSAQNGIGYRVMLDNTEITEKELGDRFHSVSTVHIQPVPVGSGAIGKIVTGVALLGLGLTGVGLLGLAPATLALVGGTMALGGVVSLFNQPQAPDAFDNSEKDGQPSFIFNGAVNTSRAGGRVPVVYGRAGIVVGSQVISSGIRSYLVDVDNDEES